MSLGCIVTIYGHTADGAKVKLREAKNIITANGLEHIAKGYPNGTKILNTLAVGSDTTPTVFEDNGVRQVQDVFYSVKAANNQYGEFDTGVFIPQTGQIWNEMAVGHTDPADPTNPQWFNRVVFSTPFDTTEFLTANSDYREVSIGYEFKSYIPNYQSVLANIDVNGTAYNIQLAGYVDEENWAFWSATLWSGPFQVAMNDQYTALVGGTHEGLNIPGNIYKDDNLHDGQAAYRLEFVNVTEYSLPLETFRATFAAGLFQGTLTDGAAITLAPGQKLSFTIQVGYALGNYRTPVGPHDVAFTGGQSNTMGTPSQTMYDRSSYPLQEENSVLFSTDTVKQARLKNRETGAYKNYWSSNWTDPETGLVQAPVVGATEMYSNRNPPNYRLESSAIANGCYDVEFDYGQGWVKGATLAGQSSSSYTYPAIEASHYVTTAEPTAKTIKLTNVIAGTLYVKIWNRILDTDISYTIKTDTDVAKTKYIVLNDDDYRRLRSAVLVARYADDTTTSKGLVRYLSVEIPNVVLGQFIDGDNKLCFVYRYNNPNGQISSTISGSNGGYRLVTSSQYWTAIQRSAEPYAPAALGTLTYPGPSGTVTVVTSTAAAGFMKVNGASGWYPAIKEVMNLGTNKFVLPPMKFTVDRVGERVTGHVGPNITKLRFVEEGNDTVTFDMDVTPNATFNVVPTGSLFSSKYYTVHSVNAEGTLSKGLRFRGYMSSIVPKITDAVYNGSNLTLTFTRPAIDIRKVELRRWGFAMYSLDLTEGTNILYLTEALDSAGQYGLVAIDENANESDPFYIFGEKPNDIVVKPANTEPMYTVNNPETSDATASVVMFSPDNTKFVNEDGSFWWQNIEWKATLNNRPATVTSMEYMNDTYYGYFYVNFVIENDIGDIVTSTNRNGSGDPMWYYLSAPTDRSLKLKLWHDWLPYQGYTDSAFYNRGRVGSTYRVYGQGTGYLQSTEITSGHIRRSLILDTLVYTIAGSCPMNFDSLVNANNLPATSRMLPYANVSNSITDSTYYGSLAGFISAYSFKINNKPATVTIYEQLQENAITHFAIENEDGIKYKARVGTWSWERVDRAEHVGDPAYTDIVDTIQFCSAYSAYSWSTGYILHGPGSVSSLSFDTNIRYYIGGSNNDWMAVKAWVRPYMTIDSVLTFNDLRFASGSYAYYGRPNFRLNTEAMAADNEVLFKINDEVATLETSPGSMYLMNQGYASDNPVLTNTDLNGTSPRFSWGYPEAEMSGSVTGVLIHMPYLPTAGRLYEKYRNTLVNKDDYLPHDVVMSIASCTSVLRYYTMSSNMLNDSFNIGLDLSKLSAEQRTKKILIPFVTELAQHDDRLTVINSYSNTSFLTLNGVVKTPMEVFVDERAGIIVEDRSTQYKLNHNFTVTGYIEIDAATGQTYESKMTGTKSYFDLWAKYSIVAKDTWTTQEQESYTYDICNYSYLIGGPYLPYPSHPLSLLRYSYHYYDVFANDIAPEATFNPEPQDLYGYVSQPYGYAVGFGTARLNYPYTGYHAASIGLSVLYVRFAKDYHNRYPEAPMMKGMTGAEAMAYIDSLIEGKPIVNEMYIIDVGVIDTDDPNAPDVMNAIGFHFEYDLDTYPIVGWLNPMPRYLQMAVGYSLSSGMYPKPIEYPLQDTRIKWYKKYQDTRKLVSDTYTLEETGPNGDWHITRGPVMDENHQLVPIRVRAMMKNLEPSAVNPFKGGDYSNYDVNGFYHPVVNHTYNATSNQYYIHVEDYNASSLPYAIGQERMQHTTLGNVIYKLMYGTRVSLGTNAFDALVDVLVNEERVKFTYARNVRLETRNVPYSDVPMRLAEALLSDGARLVVDIHYGQAIAYIADAPVTPAKYYVRMCSVDSDIYNYIFYNKYDTEMYRRNEKMTPLAQTGMGYIYVNSGSYGLSVYDIEGNFPSLEYPEYSNNDPDTDYNRRASNLYRPSAYYASTFEDFAANYFVTINNVRATLDSYSVGTTTVNGDSYDNVIALTASVSGVTVTYLMIPEIGCYSADTAFTDTDIDNVLIGLVCTRTIINDQYPNHQPAFTAFQYGNVESMDNEWLDYGYLSSNQQDIFYVIAGITRYYNPSYVDQAGMVAEAWTAEFNKLVKTWDYDLALNGPTQLPLVPPEDGFQMELNVIPLGLNWSDLHYSKQSIITRNGGGELAYIDAYSNDDDPGWFNQYRWDFSFGEFGFYNNSEASSPEEMFVYNDLWIHSSLIPFVELFSVHEFVDNLFVRDEFGGGGGEAMRLMSFDGGDGGDGETLNGPSVNLSETTYYRLNNAVYDEETDTWTPVAADILSVDPFVQWWTDTSLPIGTYAKAYTMVNPVNQKEALVIAAKFNNPNASPALINIANSLGVATNSQTIDKANEFILMRIGREDDDSNTIGLHPEMGMNFSWDDNSILVSTPANYKYSIRYTDSSGGALAEFNNNDYIQVYLSNGRQAYYSSTSYHHLDTGYDGDMYFYRGTEDLEYLDFTYATAWVETDTPAGHYGDVLIYDSHGVLIDKSTFVGSTDDTATIRVARETSIDEETDIEYERFIIINRKYNPDFVRTIDFSAHKEYENTAEVFFKEALSLARGLVQAAEPRYSVDALASTQAVGPALEYMMMYVPMADITEELLNAIHRPIEYEADMSFTVKSFTNIVHDTVDIEGELHEVLRFDFDAERFKISYEYIGYSSAGEAGPSFDTFKFPNLKPYTMSSVVEFKTIVEDEEEVMAEHYAIAMNCIIRSKNTTMEYCEPLAILPRTEPYLFSDGVFRYPDVVEWVQLYTEKDYTNGWEVTAVNIGRHNSPLQAYEDTHHQYIELRDNFYMSGNPFYGVRPISLLVPEVLYVPLTTLYGVDDEIIIDDGEAPPYDATIAWQGYDLTGKFDNYGMVGNLVESLVDYSFKLGWMDGARITNTTDRDINLEIIPTDDYSHLNTVVDVEGDNWSIGTNGGVIITLKPGVETLVRNIFCRVPVFGYKTFRADNYDTLNYGIMVDGKEVAYDINRYMSSFANALSMVGGLTVEQINGRWYLPTYAAGDIVIDITPPEAIEVDSLFTSQGDNYTIDPETGKHTFTLRKSATYVSNDAYFYPQIMAMNMDETMTPPTITVNGEEMIGYDESLASAIIDATNGECESYENDDVPYAWLVNVGTDIIELRIRPNDNTFDLNYEMINFWTMLDLQSTMSSTELQISLLPKNDGTLWLNPSVAGLADVSFYHHETEEPITWTVECNGEILTETASSKSDIITAISGVGGLHLYPGVPYVEISEANFSQEYEVVITINADYPQLPVLFTNMANATYDSETKQLRMILQPDQERDYTEEQYNRPFPDGGDSGVIIAS